MRTYNSTEQYLDQLPDDRKLAMTNLRETILNNLPEGFVETISYGMIGYVVPHSLYPDGYHADPKMPLPFINIASQKSHIAVYHMGIYADGDLLAWFLGEYPKHSKKKPDMGKSCIRFRKADDIPFDLIAELVRKISPEEWIKSYESIIKSKKILK